MNNLWNALLSRVDGEVCALRNLVLLGDARKVRELAAPRLGVHAPAVGLFAVLQRCRNVDEEKVARAAVLRDDISSCVAPTLMRCCWGSDDSRAGARELRGYPGDALQLGVAIFGCVS